MKVLLPINLDRVRSPIPTLLREVATRLGDHQFESFSSPQSEEDRACSEKLWGHPNIKRTTAAKAAVTRYDRVWHASVTPANVAAATLAKLRSFGRCRHVATANVEMGSSLRYSKLFPIALRRADCVVSVSKAVAGSLERDYGIKTDAVVPNGFDPEFYSPGGDGELPEGVEAPFFLFCGALTQRKRPDLLVEIAALLPDSQFVAVGGNPLPGEGAAFLKAFEDSPNIRYLGHQSRAAVRDLMRGATALLFPSEREGLPLSVIEAMGCGCPVLAQPKSSLPEVIVSGENGWLIADAAEQWAERCRLITPEGAPERPLSDTVRGSVVDRFSWEQIAAQYSKLLS